MHSFAFFVLRRAKRARAAGRCADWAAGFSAPPPAGAVFCRKQRKKLQKKAPLPGADSPYQGEMSRRDKRGRDAGSAQPRLRGCREFATADASGGPIFSVLPEKIGEKRGAGLRLGASCL